MNKYIQFFLLLTTVGCRLGPDYVKPASEVVDQWKHEETACDCVSEFTGLWWEVFDDETLNCLEEQALAYNPNLKAALDKVAEARAIAGVDRSALYPQINLNPSFSDTGTLFKIYLPPGGINVPGFNALTTPYRIHEYQYVMPLMMRYEVDLWGKLQGQYYSAVFNAQAQEENYHVAMLTLTADLASSYFQLRSLDAQIASLRKNLEWLRQNEEMVENRFNKGLVNYEDVASAMQQFSTTEGTYYDLLRQRALQENLIGTLIGLSASEFSLEPMPLLIEPPCVPAGLPADILLKRPDIAAAERSAASEHALIGVAYASFFPSLELTGSLGYSSPTLNDFLHWKSRLWSMAANAAQTVFDAGRNFSNLDLAYAYFNQASHEYQQTVLTALQEVEDSLANLEFQAKEYASYKRAYEASEKRIVLSNRRYKQGVSNYLSVIDSERTAIQVELSLITVLGGRYQSTVQLIKALGGSWNND